MHRYLCQQGIDNYVVDSSSIHVQRRARWAKTDRLDAHRLLQLLLRFVSGERHVWSVVHVPNRDAEDLRQFHRELGTLKRDRTRVTNRIKGLLASQGVDLDVTGDFETRLVTVRLWDGSPLSPGFLRRLRREAEKWRWLTRQIAEVEAEQRQELQNSNDSSIEMIRRLMRLRGVGASSAWLFVTEFFAWRSFQNRREVGALAGLAPTPHQSGASHREMGISKSGNRLVRTMAIEIAWGWLRYQPQSALSQWYEQRFAHGGARMRRVGIVALARKLLVDLWRYVETGVVPEGAVLKS